MGKVGGDKFKGKKKVKNALEKKAKGLKLNKLDRKRAVKMEQQIAQKEELKQNVRAELERFEAQNEDDGPDSACSESSFGSQPAKKPSKRVSFSGNMERVKVFDKNVKDLDIKPSDASPGRGILRVKGKAKAAAAAKKQKEEPKTTKSLKRPAEKKEEPEESSATVDNNKENTESEEPVAKKKKVMITKKDKEKLLALPRKERKAFLRELKAKKNPLANKALEAKQLWEKVRSKKVPQGERDECVSKLVGIVKGNAAKFIYAHDTCRVIECLLALKRDGITNMLFNELTPEIVRMAKSKYARFFVTKMLKVGSKHQRDTIINAFNGHAVSLMRIVHAAEVLELAYNDYADQQQRYNIISEFYGKEFVVFRSETPRTLSEIVTAEPAKKKLILQFMEEQLQILVEKTTLRCSLTHRLLLDFLSHCDNDQYTNMVDSLKDKIPEIVHTPEGSHVAMKIIWKAGAKDRKLIVKNFKDLSVKAAVEHYGHRVLQAIFDTVDDTVLVNKYIVSELGNEIGKLILDPWGEKLIHYLVHPRDGRGMEKKEIMRLKEGDGNQFSKKDQKDRYAELYKGIQENLYTYLAANIEELIYEHQKSKFVTACLETTSQFDLFHRVVPSEYRKSCNRALIELAKQEFIPMDGVRLHLIEDPHGSFVLNGVMRCDKDLAEEDRLAVMMVNEMEPKEYGSWIACNKGCHILAKMIQCGSPIVKQKIRAAVNMKQLKEYTFKGALLLFDELK